MPSRDHRRSPTLALALLCGCFSEHVVIGDGACHAVEVCDGIDNDCDGFVDEHVPGMGAACTTLLPEPCAQGFLDCVAGEVVCTPLNRGARDVCDGIDNDCDGEIDEDGAWVDFNQGLDGGFATHVAFDPRHPGVAYAALGRRLYRSHDGGASFTLASTAPSVLRRLEFPANAPEVLYAASDGGLLISEDGLLWHHLALDGVPLRSILVHPLDAGRVYVGTTGAGIFRSTDGGLSFSPVNVGLPFSRVNDLVAHPANPDIVTAALSLLNEQQAGNGAGVIVHSTNGGATWTVALDGVGAVLDLAPCGADGGVLAAAIEWDGVATSVDHGASWSLGGLDGAPVQSVARAATSCQLVYASDFAAGVASSWDGAVTFGEASALGLDTQMPGQLVLALDPSDDTRLLAANHSGVFLSDDRGATWSRVGSIDAVVPRGLSVSAADPSTVWAATWGQGIFRRGAPFTGWDKVPSSSLPRDWIFTVGVHPDDANRVLVAAAGDLWLTTDGGASFSPTQAGVNALDFAFLPRSPVVLAATQTNGVLLSDDGGASWVELNDGLPEPWSSGSCASCLDARSVLIDPDAPAIAYVGTAGKGVYRRVGPAPWENLDPALEGAEVGCLTKRGDTLYACVEGQGIWTMSSADPGFVPLTQGDPRLNNVRDILLDAVTGDLFVTSPAGVFRSPDGSTFIELDNSCLTHADVHSPALVHHGMVRVLVVGTVGGGVIAHQAD